MNNASPEKQRFLAQSELKAHDLTHKHKVSVSINEYNAAVKKAMRQFSGWGQARKQAKNIKWKAIEQLDKHLELFEKKFVEHGGKVLWAENTEEALSLILSICQEKNARTIVKSKSMVTEEIGLDAFLKKQEIDVIETDLGAYIQQLSNEPPYHIVMPAMHKSKEDIARLFHEKLDAPPNLTPPELTAMVRKILRQKYREAEIGITGGNFLIAGEGAVCVTENEGNAMLTTAFPKTHIVVSGIEKILPSLKDLELFWPLLSTSGSGQRLTAYNSIFFGPRQVAEIDGPRDMYVILLDNGRTELLDKKMRPSLYCIRCGACLNACPVYKNIGGHTYDATYGGPIGSVITPHLEDMHSYGHLSYASTLCGNCSKVCPVDINIHEMLLENRHIYVQEGYASIKEKVAWRLFKRAMLHRSLMNSASGKVKNFVFQKIFKKTWGERRAPLHFPEKSFNQLWKKRKGHITGTV